MATTHNILGLDVGSRRIGVAIASLEARVANALLTLDRQKTTDIFSDIVTLLKQHEVGSVVVGLPRGMEGQETAQTAIARQFAHELECACGLPIYMQDEAATSLVAEEELKFRRKPYEKGDIDKLAAAIILQDWLAGQVAKVSS